jgi:6-phosphofructo-2-kinase / fructose-2,6-biphosphatase 2
LFIESICDDEELILANIREVKLSSPDYRDSPDGAQAVEDFRQRIQHYADVYEPLDVADANETLFSFVKLINIRSRIVINRVCNYLESRIVFYLVNLHIKPRSIYIIRHGESQHNVEGKIGGDALLSKAGQEFAKQLPGLLNSHLKPETSALKIWTSTLRRTIQTASKLPYPRRALKALDELDAGVCDGLTYEEISQQYPEDFSARDHDKFNYRYRGGESYADLVHRIEPVIMELERVENVLIISHQAIIRVILAYFLDKKAEEMPYIQVPLHTLIKLTPKAYDCGFEVFPLPIPAVDTFRPKPK